MYGSHSHVCPNLCNEPEISVTANIVMKAQHGDRAFKCTSGQFPNFFLLKWWKNTFKYSLLEWNLLILPSTFDRRNKRRRMCLHWYVVDVPSVRTKHFATSLALRNAEEWNLLPASVFLGFLYHRVFKARVNQFLLLGCATSLASYSGMKRRTTYGQLKKRISQYFCQVTRGAREAYWVIPTKRDHIDCTFLLITKYQGLL